MDDLISRQEAIEALYQWMKKPSNDEEWQELLGVIKDVPPTQPEPRWIPVAERLPEADKRVLICNDEGRYLIGFVKDFGDYWPSEWWYQFDMYDDDVYEEQEQGRIVAWIPLPKPYERSEE